MILDRLRQAPPQLGSDLRHHAAAAAGRPVVMNDLAGRLRALVVADDIEAITAVLEPGPQRDEFWEQDVEGRVLRCRFATRRF